MTLQLSARTKTFRGFQPLQKITLEMDTQYHRCEIRVHFISKMLRIPPKIPNQQKEDLIKDICQLFGSSIRTKECPGINKFNTPYKTSTVIQPIQAFLRQSKSLWNRKTRCIHHGGQHPTDVQSSNLRQRPPHPKQTN